MADMTDKELIAYLQIHCQTPIGLVHASHLSRLLELAGRENQAKVVRSSGVDWWRPNGQWINELADEASARMARKPAPNAQMIEAMQTFIQKIAEHKTFAESGEAPIVYAQNVSDLIREARTFSTLDK